MLSAMLIPLWPYRAPGRHRHRRLDRHGRSTRQPLERGGRALRAVRPGLGKAKTEGQSCRCLGASGEWRTRRSLFCDQSRLPYGTSLATTGLDSNETFFPPDRRGDAGVLGRGVAPVGARGGRRTAGAPERAASMLMTRHGYDRAKQRHAPAASGDEVQQALGEAGDEVRQAVARAHVTRFAGPSTRCAGRCWRTTIDVRTIRRRPAAACEREEAEGLPVPIVPGTRVTEAQARPPVPPDGAIKTRRRNSPRTPHRSPGRQSSPRSRHWTDRSRRPRSGPWLMPAAGCANEVAELARSRGSALVDACRIEMLDAMVAGDEPRRPVQKDYGDSLRPRFTVDTRPSDAPGLIEVYNRRAGRAAAGQAWGHAGIHLDLPGRRFRLHSRRRGDQGLLHQSAEDAGRRRRRCSGRDHLPDGRVMVR